MPRNFQVSRWVITLAFQHASDRSMHFEPNGAGYLDVDMQANELVSELEIACDVAQQVRF
jgi:hypothetical protein